MIRPRRGGFRVIVSTGIAPVTGRHRMATPGDNDPQADAEQWQASRPRRRP